jgi:hypothetical protein
VLETLIDRGLLQRENGGWALSELPPDFDVPDSVQAVLSARIDLLEPTEKEALQAAAVIGRVFWSGPIYELVQGEPDLRVLEERDFVRRRAGTSMAGEREYAIKHTLTREVAYGSLPKTRRARLHAAFAAWLERLGERDDLASLLAHHYAESVRPEDADLIWSGDDAEASRLRAKAVAWLRRAADLAITRYEMDDALSLFRRALELEPDDDMRAEVWRAIGRIHALNYEGEAFWTAMERSLEVSSGRAVSAETYAELAVQTSARGGMWPTRPPMELVDGWIANALELAEPESPARAKALIATAMWRWSEGVKASTEASELADRLGDPELRALAYIARALSNFASVNYDEASVWAERTRELEPEIRDPDLEVEVYFTGILPAMGRGDFSEARHFARIHDELNARLSPHHRLHGVSGLIEVEELAGGWERISGLEQRAEKAVDENLATPCIRNSRALLLCALACHYRGDEDASRRLEERAEEVSLEGYGLTLGGPRIRLALARGDLDKVDRLVGGEHTFPQVFHLGSQAALLDGLAALGDRERTEDQAEPFLRPGTYLEPFALRALGLVREDEELIRQALQRFEALGLDWYADETRRLVAQA